MNEGPPNPERPQHDFGIEIGLLVIVIAVCIYLARKWEKEEYPVRQLPPPAEDEAEKNAKQRGR
jgi:hypothetical protein